MDQPPARSRRTSFLRMFAIVVACVIIAYLVYMLVMMVQLGNALERFDG